MSCAVWRSSGRTGSGARHHVYADRARAGASRWTAAAAGLALEHEDIQLKGYVDGGEAYIGIAAWSPTTGAGSRTPTEAWRDGIGGGFLDTAVEMTLRLDNARYFRGGKKIPRFSTNMFLK